MATSYTLLESTASKALGIQNPNFNASAPSFYASTSFLLMLSFVILATAGFVMFGHAGVIRLAASEQAISKSNAEFKRVILGLLGVFLLFPLLYSFNKDLLLGDIGLTGLRAARAGVAAGGSLTNESPDAPDDTLPPDNSVVGNEALKSDAVIRQQLKNFPNGGINVNKSACSTPSQTSCTTVGGWPGETIAMLSNLRGICPGNIIVTGGTEAGHKSHGPGKTPVDLSIGDADLNSCIRKFPQGPSRNFCNVTYTNFGYIFCDEINTAAHWHVYK